MMKTIELTPSVVGMGPMYVENRDTIKIQEKTWIAMRLKNGQENIFNLKRLNFPINAVSIAIAGAAKFQIKLTRTCS